MGTRQEAGRKVTIREVARKAKVSTATVSRVLAGVNVVSEDLAERVREVARQLHYQPNRVARSLRAQTSRIVGVLIPNIQNPFFTGIIRGIEDVLQATDYTLLLGNSDDNLVRERNYIDLLRAEGVGGFIVVPGKDAAATYHDVLAAGIPLVSVDRFVEQLTCDNVTVTNEDGAASAIRHLLALGHKRIGVVTGPQHVSTARERFAGYTMALSEAKVPLDHELIRHVVYRQEGGYEAALNLMALPSAPTAIFAASDFLALGVIRALHERRTRIPEDVAVVSFDDMPWASALSPPLTTVSQPTYKMGAAAARLLLERIADPERPLQRVRLQTELIVRSSCGTGRGESPLASARV